MRRALGIVLAAALLPALWTACGDESAPDRSRLNVDAKAIAPGEAAPFKVGFVYVGPVGDGGWTYSHDQGRQALERLFPNVKTTFVENVKEGADAERVLTRLAEDGHRLIFATSFGYMDAVLAVAPRFPRTVFMHATGFKQAENVGTYFGRAHQTIYLAGLAGGRLSQSGKLGYVAPVPIPEVIRHVNAFALGARAAHPEAAVHVVWTNAWYDPVAEKDAARSLIDAGCDVIMTEGDSPAPLQAAEERGVHAIGYNSDARSFAPTRFVTAAVWDWSVLYAQIVREVRSGSWRSQDYWPGIETGITALAPWGPNVPAELQELVAGRRQAILDGSLEVFQGPIRRQDGSLAVPAGETASDSQLLEMDYFVEGVVGTIPR